MMAMPDSSTPALTRSQLSTSHLSSTPLKEMANTPVGSQLGRLSDSIHHSSVWLARQMGPTFQSSFGQRTGSAPIDHQTIIELMEELDGEMIQLIGIEQQMQSIGLKCRMVRESMMTKSNVIHAMLKELITNNSKVVLTMGTQTDFSDVAEVTKVDQSSGHCVSSSPLLNNTFRKRRLSSVHEINTCSPILESEPKVMSKDLSDYMKYRFRRLPALVKGYLTRRLMKTERVERQIKTIRELSRMTENPVSTPSRTNNDSLLDYCLPHLKKSRKEFYEIFFNYSKAEQMELIGQKRDYVLDKHFKNGIPISGSNYLHHSFHDSINNNGISSATKRLIQRKAQAMSEAQNPSAMVGNATKHNKILRNSLKKPSSETQSPSKKPTTRAATLRQRASKKN